MQAKDVTKWVNGCNRRHAEAGLELDRARELTISLKRADQFELESQTELTRLDTYLQSTAKIHILASADRRDRAATGPGRITGEEGVRMVMFKSQGRALGFVAVAACAAELAVASMLAPSFFFGVPPFLAVFLAMLIAVCLAMGAHGAFVQAIDITSPLRQIRLLRRITNVMIAFCGALLTPLLLSRVIVLPMPGLLLSAPLALLALFLPTTAGACSALRTIYLRAWDAPSKRRDQLASALETVQSWRRNWERELHRIGKTNDRQLDLDLDQRTA